MIIFTPERKITLATVFGAIFLTICFIFVYRIPHRNISFATIDSPIMAIKLAESVEEIHAILGGPEEEGYYIRLKTLKSALALLYWLVVIYLFYSVALFELGFYKSRLQPAWRLVFYSLLAMSFVLNLIENYKFGLVLEAKSQIVLREKIVWLKELSLLRYFLYFFLSGIIGMFFWLSPRSYLLKISAIFLFTAFTLSLVGLFRYYLLEISFYLFYMGILFVFLANLYQMYQHYRKLI